MKDSLKHVYLSLIRLGIGLDAQVPSSVDWKAIRKLASRQGLAAIALDGVKRLMENAGDDAAAKALSQLDIKLKFHWIGQSVVAYEQRYTAYRNTVAELATFYQKHSIKMMVLKGYALSINYPVPSHRPCGDIDIYLFGKYREADEALSGELGIKIDNGHHHHTVFNFKGYAVENHYDIVNVHYGHGNKGLEKILKQLATDDTHFTEIRSASPSSAGSPEETVRIYLPSPNLHALFQIKHCMSHFASTFISPRLLLDFALFARQYSSSIDWKWLYGVLRDFGMLDFFRYLRAICIEDLGFSREQFGFEEDESAFSLDESLKKRILSDMLSPEFEEEEPKKKGMIPRVAFKFRRWQANAWKQRLCYPGSRFVSFWNSVWAHILKPDSI